MVDPTPIEEKGAHPERPAPRFDANGQAAILLVESLVHGLIARSLITVDDAIDMIEDAVDVSEDFAREPRTHPAEPTSFTVLNAIRNSLSIDLPRDTAKPWPPR